MSSTDTPQQPSSPRPAPSLTLDQEITLDTAVLGVTLLPHQTEAVVACLDGSISCVDLASHTQTLLGTHESYASGIIADPTGRYVVSGGYDGLLQWHDVVHRRTLAVVKAHDFWSWQLKASPRGDLFASVSGQYLCGGYRYEPAPSREPTVKIYHFESRELIHAFDMTPPVLSTAFSPDGRYVAAGNMMGQVRIWDLASGALHRSWETPDFTSWGIIKSHHYIGGIFDLAFSPRNDDLLLCGMGPMRDPMAGNGKQTWQRFEWKAEATAKVGEVVDGERGRGLMETLAYPPGGDFFCMAGRMAQGSWNTALFDDTTGALLHGTDTKMRVTRAVFTSDSKRLLLGGAKGQGGKKEGQWTPFGRLMVYAVG